MTATNDDSGSDCDHWPDDASHLQTVAVAASGYDSHNGLRSHIYHPPAQTLKPSSPKIAPAPQVIYYQQPPQAYAYPNLQYTYAPQPMAYPAPAYYNYGPQPMMVSQPQMPNYHVYQPSQQPVAVPQQGNPWIGRTKAQVDEDNMKLAKTEGAYDKRKVVPVGVKEDQMMWCVETDGSHTLRTFISIKELKGEWKKDPRFEESWYFVREEEEKKEEKKD
ncbi:hypothetical protein LTS10_004630 [Elasticomyces elasticus]|nr:hypothetical protein LTS10_004630 [Elasticomyces elasticus]